MPSTARVSLLLPCCRFALCAVPALGSAFRPTYLVALLNVTCCGLLGKHAWAQARLHKALEHDTTLSARFFFILCLSMEIQIRTLTTHTFPGTWSSGRSRSKQVEDFRHAIQVQSAPKITRGQSLVLTSRASPKEPRMPATPSSQVRFKM